MERWIFETPWWLLIAIAIAAVALLVSGNNRQNSRLKLAGVGVLAAGAILWAVSYFVQTPREICIRQTREWIAGVVAKDQAKLGSMLGPAASLYSLNREGILARAQSAAEEYGLKSALVTSIEAAPNPALVAVDVSVITRHDAKIAAYDALPSSWRVTWGREGDKWMIQRIDPIRIGQLEKSQFDRLIFRR